MCNCSYCNESETENSFWGDVYFYMEQTNCSEEDAIRKLQKIMKIWEFGKAFKIQDLYTILK